MLAATKPYLELVKKVPLRPIESDRELDRAIATIDALLAKPSLSRDEDDYLDVLSDLVYKYENAAHPVESVPDSEMLRHLMEAKGISNAELNRRTGIPTSTIAAVLRGRRTLSREQVATLSDFFHVSTNVFALPKKSAPVARGGSALAWLFLLTLTSTCLAAPPEAGRAANEQKSLDDALLEDLESGLPRPRRSIDKPAKSSERPAGKKKDASAAEEPAKRSLDEELLDGLEGEDVSLGKDPANENPLVRLNERMKQVERRIAETHSDEKTQRLQRDISDDLAKLIAQLEQQCRQSKKPSPSAQRQQTSNSKPASKPGDQSGEKPASESSPQVRDRETAKVDPARLQQMLKDVWGHLPAHLRQQMEQSANEEFLPKYEAEISEYYRSLVGRRKERK